MSPSTKAYLLYNSPLTTLRGRILLIVISSVLFLLAVWGRYTLGIPSLLLTYSWVPYTALGSLGAFLIFSFLDRKRSFFWVHVLIVASVAFQTAFVAVLLNTYSPFPLQTVGFVEESVKIFPVLLLAIFLPIAIRTRKDGIIYGGLAGIGFNIIEVGVYIAHGLSNQSLMDVLWAQTTRFALLGFGVHIIWSMFTGLGLGMSMESTKKGLSKWKPFILILLLTAIIHSLYDSFLLGVFLAVTFIGIGLLTGKGISIQGLSLENTTKPGQMREAMILEHFVYNIVIIFIVIKQLSKSATTEQQIYVEQLSDEKENVISKEEKILLFKETRFSMRRYQNYSRNISNKIVKNQNRLAMLKYIIEKAGKSIEKENAVQLLRKEIIALRG